MLARTTTALVVRPACEAPRIIEAGL